MKFLTKTITALAVVEISLFATLPLKAVCGGEFCPIRVKKSERIHYAQTNFYEGWGLGMQQRTVGFDIGGEGYYNLWAIQPMYYHPRFSAGVIVPFLQLYAPQSSHSRYGLGNILALAEAYLLNEATMLGIGSMAELPTGNKAAGLAAEHSMLIPYTSLTQALGEGYFGGQVAYQTVVEFHTHAHEHEPNPQVLYVNPHADREIWYRAFGGWRLGSYTPELLLSGRTAIEINQVQQRHFLNVGTIQRYRLYNNVEINLNLELPILSRERELFRIGGGIYVQLAESP